MATWGTVKALIQAQTDTEDEDFVSSPEMLGYANQALNQVERIVLNLAEDYLLAKPATVTLVDGTSEYSLPTGIYAQKIRRVIYNNGSSKYLIRRIKKLEETVTLGSGDSYKYLVTNDSTDGMKIHLYPTPAEAGANVSVWFLRNINPIVDDDTVLDVSESIDYIVQFCKDAVMNKDNFTINAPPSGALQKEEQNLIESLSERFPDEDNIPEMDTSFYNEVN
jgi:hypothetical protein